MREIDKANGSDCPRGIIVTCIFHQLGLCVVMFVVAVSVASASDIGLAAWMEGTWNIIPGIADFISRHTHYSIVGYELKDFWVSLMCKLPC
jgi:hypothetical protein